MTKDQIHQLESALLDFVERASKSGANSAEVQALPEVARVLVSMIS